MIAKLKFREILPEEEEESQLAHIEARTQNSDIWNPAIE